MGNKLEPEDIEWVFAASLGGSNCHHSRYINKKYGLEMEKTANRKSEFEFAKPKTYYFITGQKKEYTDLQQLCDDWNEIKDYDDPNSEIVWEKKIVKKINL